jgi:hypothetical protein
MDAMAQYIGYHDDKDIPIKAGDTVTIKKGVTIKTTHLSTCEKIAGRTYKIRVHHILNGATSSANGEHYSNPRVRWAGAGGYWNDVDINDIPEAQDVDQD